MANVRAVPGTTTRYFHALLDGEDGGPRTEVDLTLICCHTLPTLRCRTTR